MIQDLRFGARMLLKNKGFTAVAVISLALGIGVNTSIFTLFYSVAWRPLPVKDPDRIVKVYQTYEGEVSRQVSGNIKLLSYPEYVAYRDQTHVFAGLTAYRDDAFSLGGSEGEKVEGLLVTDNYFSVLGAEAALGRTFIAKECQTPGGCPLAVLSYGFWQRRFSADPEMIGKTLTLNRQRFTVVGIAARDFRGTELTGPDVWVPLMMQAQLRPDRDFLPLGNNSWLNVVGRLVPGISIQRAKAEMSVLAAQADREYPGRKTIVSVASGTYLNGPEARSKRIPVVVGVMTAVGLVLLIACANVSNLLLARAVTRRREIGVRLAMGASRVRLIRQLLTEGLLLAVLGGAVGLFLAYWLPPIVFSVYAADGLGADLSPNLTVFGYCFLLSLATGVFFGLAPALEATRLDLISSLKDEGSAFGRKSSRSRLRGFLVVTQVAVAFVLLIGAGLLVRSLQRAHSADLGFDPKNVLVLTLDLASERYDASRASQFYRQLTERLMVLPGVRSVSLAGVVPFSASHTAGITVEGDEAKSGEKRREINFNVVSAQYFQMLGIPIVRGRAFNDDEVRSGQALAVISEAMAQRFWPAEDPIGKRFKDGSSSYEVIGVARDVSSIRLAEPDGPLFYGPASPGKQTGLAFLLRTDATHGAVMTAVRNVVRSLDKNLPISVKLMVDREPERERFGAMFSSVLGLLALALALVGIYGVTNYAVSQRTREIGIRLALGAQTNDVLRLVVRQVLQLIAIGIGIGLLLSAAGGFVLTRALYGLSALDPVTFAGVSLLVGAVSLLACYFPARKATKVDPMVALRQE